MNEYDCGAPVPADREKWASCIRVVDAATLRTLERFELADNEAAFSVCVCPFHDKGEEPFVVIGTAKNLRLHPPSCSEGFISVFRFVEGRSLELVHRTEVDEVLLVHRMEVDEVLLVGHLSVKPAQESEHICQLLSRCSNHRSPDSSTTQEGIHRSNPSPSSYRR